MFVEKKIEKEAAPSQLKVGLLSNGLLTDYFPTLL